MKTIDVVQKLELVMMATAHQSTRKYLGMSQIYKGEADILKEMYQGSPRLEAYQMAIHSLANDFEGIVLKKLEKAGVVVPGSSRGLVADFDERFRGHTKADFVDGAVCDIKSTIEEKLLQIKRDTRVPNAHYVQAQMYMHHGGYDRAIIVYVARDTGLVVCKSVKYDARTAQTYNEKAKRILAAIDNYK